jgi:D-sedoheptulose 7-phosphate isomerase
VRCRSWHRFRRRRPIPATSPGWSRPTSTAPSRRCRRCSRPPAASRRGELTAELVGRFDGEREPFSAIALHAETSAFTAIANDYGFEEVFARQVRAHGRPGDVLMLFSTSGRSPNLLRAASAARAAGLLTWSLTGAGPNPLAAATDEAVTIEASSASAQECHLVAVHALCRAFDARIAALRAGRAAEGEA